MRINFFADLYIFRQFISEVVYKTLVVINIYHIDIFHFCEFSFVNLPDPARYKLSCALSRC